MFEKLWKKIIGHKRISLWTVPALLLWLVSVVYRLLFMLKKAVTRPSGALKVPVLSGGSIQGIEEGFLTDRP